MRKYLDKILIIIAVIIVIIGVKINNKENKLEIVQEDPIELKDTEEQEPISVETFMAYISGEVLNPGVYEFNDGDRVVNLVEKAGGFTENANININLSLKLTDEMHVYIPNNDEKIENISLDIGNIKEDNGLININTASKEELTTLSGIGEKKAEDIIKYREQQKFEKIEDLMNISGIGEKTFEKLKESITI